MGTFRAVWTYPCKFWRWLPGKVLKMREGVPSSLGSGPGQRRRQTSSAAPRLGAALPAPVRVRVLYWQPTGSNPLNHGDNFRGPAPRLGAALPAPERERDLFVDNLLVRIH